MITKHFILAGLAFWSITANAQKVATSQNELKGLVSSITVKPHEFQVKFDKFAKGNPKPDSVRMVFNSKGQLIGEILYNKLDLYKTLGEFERFTYIKFYKYDETGNLIREDCYDEARSLLEYVKTYTYADGRLTEKNEYNGKRRLTKKYRYTYENGQVTEIVYRGNGSRISATPYKLDQCGYILEMPYQKHEYDEEGRIVRKTGTKLGNQEIDTIFHYNTQGDLSEAEIHYGDTRQIETRTHVYTYDSQNNWVCQRTQETKNREAATTKFTQYLERDIHYGKTAAEVNEIAAHFTQRKKELATTLLAKEKAHADSIQQAKQKHEENVRLQDSIQKAQQRINDLIVKVVEKHLTDTQQAGYYYWKVQNCAPKIKKVNISEGNVYTFTLQNNTELSPITFQGTPIWVSAFFKQHYAPGIRYPNDVFYDHCKIVFTDNKEYIMLFTEVSSSGSAYRNEIGLLIHSLSADSYEVYELSSSVVSSVKAGKNTTKGGRLLKGILNSL